MSLIFILISRGTQQITKRLQKLQIRHTKKSGGEESKPISVLSNKSWGLDKQTNMDKMMLFFKKTNKQKTLLLGFVDKEYSTQYTESNCSETLL